MFKDISALKRCGSDLNPFDSVVFIQNEDCRVWLDSQFFDKFSSFYKLVKIEMLFCNELLDLFSFLKGDRQEGNFWKLLYPAI